MSRDANKDVREIILGALTPRRDGVNRADIPDDADLMKFGLVEDSADLVDIIMIVEAETGIEFNPEGLDLETGLTLGQLIAAFSGGGVSEVA